MTPIDHCLRCYRTCLDAALSHCLVVGGRHADPRHVRLMLDCSEICRACADVMVRGSPWHERLCEVCADVCVQCAESCEQLGDSKMSECAETCRACAQSCRSIAGENAGTA
jgi:hypothetical protein